MYRIAICENEAVFAEALEKNCRRLCERLTIHCTITVFHNSEDFSKAFLAEPLKFDLLLLDIIMDGLNGIELARKIRENNKEVTIIFVTSTAEFALQGYEVQALHYLLKPVDYERLGKLLQTDYAARFKKETMVLDSTDGLVKLCLDDIIALETVSRRVAVYLFDQTVYYSGKLSELAEQLPPEWFIRCHQSFVVNIKNIRELDSKNAVTTNRKLIPISRSYQKEIQKAFLRQMEN